MSLFPAYSKTELTDNFKETEKHEENISSSSWLTNTSFQPESKCKEKTVIISEESESEKLLLKIKKKNKHKTKKKHKKKIKEQVEKLEKNLEGFISDSSIYEDRKGSKANFLIPTLMKDDVPLYKKPRVCFQRDAEMKSKKILKWRYFNCVSRISKYDLTINDQCAQTNEDVLSISDTGTLPASLNLETQLSKKTASFNQRLSEDPNDEELWLQYINFQDEKHQFEKQYRKSKDSSFGTEERKLSIINKALSHNPFSESLLYRKFEIMSKIYDLDKVSDELFSVIRQDFGNLTLWKQYIQITQFTLSRCTIPKVISLYVKAMEKINFVQKGGIFATELNLLELYLECALFLRQSGLWEQLCMLIRLQLQLNLTNPDAENYKFIVQETKIREYEDEILACGLPIYSLWLRIEKLRQRVHWYPVSDADCEDPQRIVVPTDVTDLIRPITNQYLNLRLAVITMFLLKVPLIPLRDTVFRTLSLNNITWHIDSAEILLSAFCSIGITQGRFTNHEESINACLKDLVSFPQYINDEIGREEYLDFLQNIFRKISQNLPLIPETIILVWWFRFERSLLIAGKQPANRKKRLKSLIKDFLKEERHRDNIPLYVEYALLERELNQNNENCIKILETALTLYSIKKSAFPRSTARNALTQLYRVLVEMLLILEDKEKCIRVLISLAFLIPEKDVHLDDDTISKACAEFQKITEDTMDEDCFAEEDFDLHHTQPQFFVEWVCCQAWFLYLTESVWSATAFLDDLLRRMSPCGSEILIFLKTYHREIITETLIAVLHFHCNTSKTAFGILHEYLLKGIQEFPNNMRLLCTLSDLETKMHFASPWWKIEKCLRSNDSQLAKLIMIVINRRRLMMFEEANATALQVLNQGGPIIACHGLNNRMKALLIKLTRDKITQQCPLIWIIYLQYCSQYESETKFKDVFSLAIESCPWVKAFYMEGAHVLFNQVSQIQDILIEKEMRIHITQDEIEILRDS